MGNLEIIPLSVIIDNQSGRKYFHPRLIKINLHDTVQWINTDVKSHTLTFIDHYQPYEKNIGKIRPGESLSMKFDYDISRLDYYCAEHGDESGVIIIYSRPDEDMSNTDRLRFLGKVFGIKPGPYEHLNSSN